MKDIAPSMITIKTILKPTTLNDNVEHCNQKVLITFHFLNFVLYHSKQTKILNLIRINLNKLN